MCHSKHVSDWNYANFPKAAPFLATTSKVVRLKYINSVQCQRGNDPRNLTTTADSCKTEQFLRKAQHFIILCYLEGGPRTIGLKSFYTYLWQFQWCSGQPCRHTDQSCEYYCHLVNQLRHHLRFCINLARIRI